MLNLVGKFNPSDYSYLNNKREICFSQFGQILSWESALVLNLNLNNQLITNIVMIEIFTL